MPRTKQTAKKSTGGLAKRKLLQQVAYTPRSRSSRSRSARQSPNPAADVEMAVEPSTSATTQAGGDSVKAVNLGDDWCHLCSDGGTRLVICDLCGTATCVTCVPQLGTFSDDELESQYTFECAACTKNKDRFYGLWKKDKSPVFPSGMKIMAHNATTPRKQRVRTPSLVIIEFILDQLPHMGTAGQLLHLSLMQNYVAEPGRLHYEEVSFELNSSDALEKHTKQMGKVARKLGKRGFDHAVVIIHTHSDDSTGDLWYCSSDADSGGPLATPINNFFATVIGPQLKSCIQGMEFSSFFLLACGAVVRESGALMCLKSVTEDFKFTDAFAFGAKRLFSHHPAIWMMTYADQVIISGQGSAAAIGNLLYSCAVGKHTSITYLNRSTGGEVKICQYVWEHQTQRPNTHSYPLACPLCNHINPWQRIPKVEGSAFTLRCKTVFLNGVGCKGSWEVPARPTSSPVAAPYAGGWRVV